MQWYRRPAAQLVGFILSGLLIGGAAWGVDRAPYVAVMLPLVWALAANTAAATCVVFGYLVASTYSAALVSPAFFPDGQAWKGVVAWYLCVLTICAVWTTAHRFSRGPVSAAAAAVLALLVWLLPPVGVIGLTHMIIAWAALLPAGAGWTGLAGALVATAAAVAAVVAGRRRGYAGKVGLLLAALGAVFVTLGLQGPVEHRTSVASAVGVDTNLGPARFLEYDELASRGEAIALVVHQAARSGAKLVVLPEGMLPEYTEGARTIMRLVVDPILRRHDAVLIMGVERDIDAGRANSVLLTDGKERAVIDARQTMPMASWLPWGRDYVARWNAAGVISIAGVGDVMLSVCWEDVMPWLWLRTMLTEKPDLVASVANLWWATELPVIGANQRTHAMAMARLFDIPLARAVNR